MKVGDKVVCVKGHRQGIVKKGLVYIIHNIDICDCGLLSYDVGMKLPNDSDGVKCDCGKLTDCNIWWLYATHFAPIQYESAHASILKEIFIIKETSDKPIKETV